MTLYHAKAVELLYALPIPDVECVITDPPYPNNAGHFDADIEEATRFLQLYLCPHWMIFWDEISRPEMPLPHVATHIWHRTNTNRPDNYEPIYEYHKDGQKRASRVLPYAVISPGLTGCHEATGHPTQKNLKLMQRLIHMSGAKSILDPFCGSGSTLEAAKRMRIPVIGIDRDEKWCEVAAKRCAQEMLALD